MATNKKKGTRSGKPSDTSKSKSDRSRESGFESGQQASGSGKSEDLGDLEHRSKSNDDVRTGTEDVKSKEDRGEDDSELSSREGPFGQGIPPRAEGDVGYGRHSGQSGAI